MVRLELSRYFSIYVLLALLLAAGTLEGQSFRTAVSLAGDDLNNCTVVSPCRSFGRAISQTNAGGEVLVLTSAGYGSFTVDKSITIVAPPGVYAGITALSGTAIAVNAASADKIVFRGLTVTSTGATFGLQVNQAGAVHIESCDISGKGIQILSGGDYFINDTTVRGADEGVRLFGDFDRANNTSISRSRFENNGVGVFASSESRVTIVDSVFSGGSTGVMTYPYSGGSTQVDVERSVASGNSNAGISGGFGGGIATIRVSNCVVTGNNYGLYASTGTTLLSRGNNTVRANATDTFTLGGTIGTYAGN